MEAKNIERQIVDMSQYYGLTNFFSTIALTLLANDASYFTSMQYNYRNTFVVVLLTTFFGLSRPASRLTPHLPASNFMGIEHHLVYWGNALIICSGLVLSYLLFYSSSEFVPNPQP